MKKFIITAAVVLSGCITNIINAQVKTTIKSNNIQSVPKDENSLSEKVVMIEKKLTELEAANTDLKNKNASLQDALNKLKTATDANYKLLDYSSGQLKKNLEKKISDLETANADLNNKSASLEQGLSKLKTNFESHHHILNGIAGNGFTNVVDVQGMKLYVVSAPPNTTIEKDLKKTGPPVNE